MSNVVNAIKKIYPNITGGFVYWETKSNGEPWENPIDGLNWENKEFDKPTWDQIEEYIDELTDKKEVFHNQNKMRKEFLFKNGVSVGYNGNSFICSRDSSLLLSSNIVANGNSDVPWEDVEGNIIILTTAQQKDLMKIFRDKGVEIQTKFKIIEAQINALTEANVDAFDIEAAWAE